MNFWLVMKTADGGERPFPVGERTIIGRESRCQVRIALPTVANRHCELRVTDGKVLVSDLDSANGTFHNGQRVAQAVLAHQDLLTIGPVTFQLRAGSACAGSAEDADGAVPPVTLNGMKTSDPPEIKVMPISSRQQPKS